MIEYIVANKELILAAGTALLVLVGSIIKITATQKDDSVYNTIVNALGLGKFAIKKDEEVK